VSSKNWRVAAGVVSLLIILGLQLLLSVRQESQTWDEANHIYAGYKSWTSADFGLNPEHPPLVKLVATAPLLSAPPKTPVLGNRFFKEEAFLGGKDFLYQNDAEAILFRTRVAAAIFTLLLALVVFFGAKEFVWDRRCFHCARTTRLRSEPVGPRRARYDRRRVVVFHVRRRLRVLSFR
jgi:hypothetical protein